MGRLARRPDQDRLAQEYQGGLSFPSAQPHHLHSLQRALRHLLHEPSMLLFVFGMCAMGQWVTVTFRSPKGAVASASKEQA